jgi:predicted TIM-barrel fold metal-dependent hydrolase
MTSAEMTSAKIDVHFHVIPPFYRDAVYAAGTGPAIGRYPEWTPELAIEIMDKHGIAVAMTSVAQPGVGFLSGDAAFALARRCNDYGAELMGRSRGRFGAFALVPMHDIDRAVAECRYCLDDLRHEGVCLFASYGEKFLGDAAFDPMMEFLNEHAAVVFVHPTLHPSSRSLALPWPAFMIEYVFDTSRAAMNLVFSGTLARYPDIRFILAHAGGTLPYVAWRLSVAPMIDARLPQLSRADIMQAFTRFWYDNALACGPETFGALSRVAAADRIVFGSDWPFCNDRVLAEEVAAFTAPGFLAAEQVRAIGRENALKLFPGRG